MQTTTNTLARHYALNAAHLIEIGAPTRFVRDALIASADHDPNTGIECALQSYLAGRLNEALENLHRIVNG